jgi:hypothetical protein
MIYARHGDAFFVVDDLDAAYLSRRGRTAYSRQN